MRCLFRFPLVLAILLPFGIDDACLNTKPDMEDMGTWTADGDIASGECLSPLSAMGKIPL